MTPEDTPIIAARLAEFESRVKAELGYRGFAGLSLVTSSFDVAPLWSAAFHPHSIKTAAGETLPDLVRGRGPCPLSAIEAAFKALSERAQAQEAA